MGVSSKILWEVRQDATASNANGGGFNPDALSSTGQDFSQQTAAQYNLTGVTSAGAGNVVLSASAADVMLGNIGHCTGGTNATTGWFEITAVTAGVSITFSTNAAGASIATGVMAAGVINIGGAMSLNSTLDDDLFEAMTAGNTVYVRKTASVIALGETVGISLAGAAVSTINIIGYNSSRTDAPTGDNAPTIACGSSFTFTTGAFWNVKHVNFTGSSTSVLTGGTSNKFWGIRSIQSSTTAARTAISIGSTSFIGGCEAISYRGYAIGVSSGAMTIAYNYCHDSDMGIRGTSTAAYRLVGNLVPCHVTAAVQFTGANTDLTIVENTLYGRVGIEGIGISLATGVTNCVVLNNIIYGFTTGVSHADANTAGLDDYNDYSNNNSNVNNSLNWQTGSHNIATAPGFTNAVEITFSDGTTSGSVLTSATSDFSTVTDNTDFLFLRSGTGITAGKYLITAHTATTLTLSSAPGTNATADKNGSITTGMNFLPTGAI